MMDLLIFIAALFVYVSGPAYGTYLFLKSWLQPEDDVPDPWNYR